MASGNGAAFRFDGDRRGVLLVHGFTGTPFEMRLLGEALHRRGFTVACPRLAGHGGTTADLRAAGWRDWYATVENAFDELRSGCDRVAVCGLSLGGLLTLELARHRREQIAAIAALSTALAFPSWMTRGVRFFGRLGLLEPRSLPKLGKLSDISDGDMRRQNPSLKGLPIRALNSLFDFSDHVRAHLGEVDRPAFLAHARKDHTVPFASLDVVARGIASTDVEQLILERSFHVITVDVEHDLVARRVGDFLTRHLT